VALTGVTHPPDASEEPPSSSRGKRRILLFLLVPGLAWLAIFFLIPIFTLLGTSTQTPAPSGEIGAFVQTWDFGNYAR
jgi:spermidine/putrescine transport system permease protein